MWKEIMQSMPRFVKIFLCSVPFLVILKDPFMGDPLLATAVRFCIGVLLIGPEYVFLLPELIVSGGEWHLLLVIFLCLVSAFILRSLLPESAKYLAWIWPVVCFMMGQSYGLFLYSARIAYLSMLRYYLIPFELCMYPAWVGILLGKVVRKKFHQC